MMGREDKAKGEHYFGGGWYYGLGLEDLVGDFVEDLVVVLWRSLLWFC